VLAETFTRIQLRLIKETSDVQEDLIGQGYDGVVLATGVVPRNVKFPGSPSPKVVSYVDVLRHNVQVGCLPGFSTIGRLETAGEGALPDVGRQSVGSCMHR
jgi:hypothetical protein